MVEGILTINVNPPYVVFCPKEGKSSIRECTAEHIRAVLADLAADVHFQHWPVKECVIRLQGNFSRDKLEKFGLLTLRHESLPEPNLVLQLAS